MIDTTHTCTKMYFFLVNNPEGQSIIGIEAFNKLEALLLLSKESTPDTTAEFISADPTYLYPNEYIYIQ